MKSKIWIVAVLFVIGVIAAIAIARSSQGGPIGEWNASGFIEADILSIAPEIAGRVTARPVSESDQVRQGDVVLKLEDDILAAQVDLARGKLAEAQAVLAQAKAGARQESIAKAEAQLKLAQAGRDAARQAWLDAQAIRDNPQTLDVQIAAASAQVDATRAQLDAALLQRDIAEEAWKDYGETSDKLADVPPAYRPSLPIEYYSIPYQWEQALAAVNVAQANYSAAQTALKNLQAQRSNPQEATDAGRCCLCQGSSRRSRGGASRSGAERIEGGRDGGTDCCGASAGGCGAGRAGSGADSTGQNDHHRARQRSHCGDERAHRRTGCARADRVEAGRSRSGAS